VVEFYNYDEGDLHATVQFADQAPTANGGLHVDSGDLTPFIGGDPAGGGNDLDAKVTYTLSSPRLCRHHGPHGAHRRRRVRQPRTAQAG
jgi:hypothetical protein